MATGWTAPQPGEVWRLGILDYQKATVLSTRRNDFDTLIVKVTFFHQGRKETMELWATDLTRKVGG